MSRLEGVARRVLAPLLLGEPGGIEPGDQGAIAAWAQKTALVAMLVSADADRAKGYGLPASEYGDFHAVADLSRPLPACQFWIGRYEGTRLGSVLVTPVVVAVDGLPEPVQPHAYVITIVIGQVVLHGVRFTSPAMSLDLSSERELPQLWPVRGRVDWPGGTTVDDAAFVRFSRGRDLRVSEPHIALRPWGPATDLEQSTATGSMVELPLMCGEHVAFYPVVLVQEATIWGRFYAFMTACDCDRAYLIETEADGAHCKAAGDPAAIAARYEALPGRELLIEDDDGIFVCKRLTAHVDPAGVSRS